jgi:ribosome biogenesis ATPase
MSYSTSSLDFHFRGKTHLANAIAGQLGVPYFCVSAPELVSSMSGDSEGRIRELFQAASDLAPAIIFLDEIDAVAPKRSDASGARGMEKRMVAQLLTSMDQVKPSNNRDQNAVLVLAATNRPDALDPALRRAGRFDKEIFLGVPDEEAREKILRAMTKDMRLAGKEDDKQFDYKLLARKTPGFVGADIKSLAKEAAVVAINRIFRNVLREDFANDSPNVPGSNEDETRKEIPGPLTPLTKEQMEPLYVTMDDFLIAIPLVQPSSKREGFATVPDVTWENVGALEGIREELSLSVLEPIRSPEKFQALGLPLPAGVLLYGPPGCGKTLLAKAVANESGANFISVKGPELLDKYVGESEKAVRLVFDRARSSSPCIVFFDELDSLVPRRGSDNGGGGVSERVVNQLLTEMDGLESRRSVFIIAATNRPELIDPAMMRPGRLDKLLYVPLPTALERVSILKTLASKVTLGNDVDLDSIGMSSRAEGYSGADCAALLREAGLAVLKEDALATSEGRSPSSVELRIMAKHFEVAFTSVLPSVSKKDQSRYDRIRDRMAHARSRGLVNTTDVEEENPFNANADKVDDKKST